MVTRLLLGPLGSAAAAYARRGWPVLPLHAPAHPGCSCNRDDCGSVGKHPRITGWREAATTDPDTVTKWWRQWPHANIGIATGQASRLIVVDIDARHGGESSYADLRRRYDIPRTALAATGTGRHLYFAAAEGQEMPNSVGTLGDGVDVRADGGYIVAPPSHHANGRTYRWIGSHRIEGLPLSLVNALQPRHPVRTDASSVTHADAYTRAAFDRECAAVRAAPEHTRNNTLNRAAFSLGQLVESTALTESAVFDGLLAAAADVGLPGREAMLTIRSGLRGGRRKPRSLSRQPGASTNRLDTTSATQATELPSP